MNEVLVVGAAPAAGGRDFYRSLLSSAEAVVAADAAGEWCARLGRVPDLVVGDFDSSDPGELERLERGGSRLERHPADKDLTDLELAVDAARTGWALPVCLTAAFSDRLDHTLAALGLLARSGADARAREPSWSAWPCLAHKTLRLSLPEGTVFSIIALEPCTGVTVSGGRWGLEGEELAPLSGRAISNESTGEGVEVALRSGRLVLIVNLQGR